MHPTPHSAGARAPKREPDDAPPALPGDRRRRLLVRLWLGLTIAAAAVAAIVAPKSMPDLAITNLSGARWVGLLGPILALLMILGLWRLVHVALRGSESRPRQV